MAKAQKKTAAPDIEEMLVTPAMATNWLNNNKFNNRALSERVVNKIARDITNNKWVYDASPIRFDKEGNLIDGQHRLWAVIKAQKSVKILVIRNLEANASDVIDTGKARNNSDVLHFHGFINTTTVANACRISLGYALHKGDLLKWAGGASKLYLSPQEIVKEAESNPKLISSINTIASQKFIRRFMGVGTAAFCHYIFSFKDKLMADEFFYLLEKGTDLPEGHPVLTLRNSLTLRAHLDGKILKMLGSGNYRTVYIFAIITKAWNVFRKGEEIKKITFRPNIDNYPTPI